MADHLFTFTSTSRLATLNSKIADSSKVFSSDIEDIISKLSSDKTKTREEGIKLLKGCIEGGEKSVRFCQYVSRQTAKLKPNQIPQPQTWPFLLKVLIQCIASEVLGSKRRLPNKIFADVLRIFIQRAENGRMLFLLSVVKSLVNHIWDVLKDVPSFQSQYGIALRHLLGVNEYRFHIGKKAYCGLVLLHMGKVLEGVKNIWSNAEEDDKKKKSKKENVFHVLWTLHSLLENPPGDFPDNIREDIVKGFKGISDHMKYISKDDGNLSRKFIECINTYLMKDGPNLDNQAMEIHSAVEDIVLRCWLTTDKRDAKVAVIFYARLQLKLIRSTADGVHIVEQILDVVSKDLDQSITPGIWKDDKHGILTSSRCELMELAASVFYKACVNTAKTPSSEKRPRREGAAFRLRQGLMKGKWLWNCAFCFLIRKYQSQICQDLMLYWFEGLCENFESILNEGNSIKKIANEGKKLPNEGPVENTYDGLLWVLRSLQELSSMRLLPVFGANTSQCTSPSTNQLCSGWLTIWNSLIHALPIFSNVTSVADAALSVLGNIISKELICIPTIPQDFWDLRLFKHMPSAC